MYRELLVVVLRKSIISGEIVLVGVSQNKIPGEKADVLPSPSLQEFNELEYYSQIPGSDTYRYNFWGYSTAGFFAPMSRCGQ